LELRDTLTSLGNDTTLDYKDMYVESVHVDVHVDVHGSRAGAEKLVKKMIGPTIQLEGDWR
jgi:hypothetical protein|tara:strand:- start:289 stop:471 length:183 start_codon:yes stop_codon:yes gene_type:complete